MSLIKAYLKWIIVSILLLAIYAVGYYSKGVAENKEYEPLTCIVEEGSYVNIRSRPSTKASSLGRLHTKDIIIPEDISNGFVKFMYGDKVAYAKIDYFEIDTECLEYYIIDSNGRVRVRDTPNGKAEGWVYPGDEVPVFGWRYDQDETLWARVTGNQYIAAEYLTRRDE